MKLLKKYFKTIDQIYEYFDYESGPKVLPLEDYTDFDWTKNKNEIYYSIEEGSDYITDEFIEEYKGEEYTMYLIKDSLNLEDCLLIFDNKKYLTENDYRD